MRRWVMAAVVAACVGTAGPARADDKGGLSGTWEWIVHRDGKAGVATVELKLEGDKITGFMHGRDGKNMKGRALGLVVGTIGRGVLEKAFRNSVKAIEARKGAPPKGVA